ncbi:MAG: DNA recombination protein RmuC, partial [Pseudomonadota bacterium]|nr:DNA recombination protein RmuC [Pseudomonadota bacterium]
MTELLTTSNLLPWVLLAATIGCALGAALQHVLRARSWALRMQKARDEGAAESADKALVREQELAEQQSQMAQNNAALLAQVEMQSKQLQEQGQELQNVNQLLAKSRSDLAGSQARMQEMQRGFAEKEEVFAKNSAMLKQEFELLAKQVLDQQESKQQQSLQLMLKPFREQIGDFKQRVEEVHKNDVKERASLLTEMQNLQKASERINTEAENLTKALKG